MPKINMEALTKGEIRKLNSLKTSVGDELGEGVFIKWLSSRAAPAPVVDKVAEKIRAALESAGLADDRGFRLGNYGYTIRKSRGKGASGFDIKRNEASAR